MELKLVTELRVGDTFIDVSGNKMKLIGKEKLYVIATRIDRDKHDYYANCAKVMKVAKEE